MIRQTARGLTRSLAMASLAAAAALALAIPAAAEPLILPEGVACPGFDLGLESSEGHRVIREFTDASGQVVRMITAGTGGDLVLTNEKTGDSLVLPSSGAVMRETFDDDGTSTVVLTGHWVLILFPTDVPAGPSTTLHVGRVVYTVDADQVFTVQKVTGRTADLCAALTS